MSLWYLNVLVILIFVSVIIWLWRRAIKKNELAAYQADRNIALEIAKELLEEINNPAGIDLNEALIAVYDCRLESRLRLEGVNRIFSFCDLIPDLGVSPQDLFILLEMAVDRRTVRMHLGWLRSGKGDMDIDWCLGQVEELIAKYEPHLDDLRPTEDDIFDFRRVRNFLDAKAAEDRLQDSIAALVEAVDKRDEAVDKAGRGYKSKLTPTQARYVGVVHGDAVTPQEPH